MLHWLVVEPTHLKNMLVKMGSSSPIFGVNMKNIWNHHPGGGYPCGNNNLSPVAILGVRSGCNVCQRLAVKSKRSTSDTVYGRNPAPPDMYETLQVVGYLPHQLVQDFFHQPYWHGKHGMQIDFDSLKMLEKSKTKIQMVVQNGEESMVQGRNIFRIISSKFRREKSVYSWEHQ